MMNNANVENLVIENASIIFRNFSGRPTKFVRQEGVRSFSVLIDDDVLAQHLSDIGWNVRILRPRDENDEVKHCIDVAINFNFWKKPEVNLICGNVMTRLDEEDLGQLDGVEIINADLVIRPRMWDDDGTTRIKAYLQELYVTIEQNRFANKYADFMRG